MTPDGGVSRLPPAPAMDTTLGKLRTLIHERRLPRRVTEPVRQWRERLFPEHHANLGVFSRKPLILYTNAPLGEGFAKVIRRRRVIILGRLNWRFEQPEAMDHLAGSDRAFRRLCPNARTIYCCNSQVERTFARERGLEAEWINHNTFIDENLFTPDPTAVKRFDAIYDAQLYHGKRHELAAEVRSLALISFINNDSLTDDYRAVIERTMAHAYWFNNPLLPDWRKLTLSEIAAAYNQARTGLALSAAEGAMRASLQYLLCGLPVVSTRAEGGRDTFFTEDTALIVEDKASAVAEGVRTLIARELDPLYVRERTLEVVREKRAAFCAFIDRLRREEGVEAPPYAEEFPERFHNLMIRWNSLNEVLKASS